MQIQNFHTFISAFSQIISCINICKLKNFTHSCTLKNFIYAFSRILSIHAFSKSHASFQKVVCDRLGMAKVTFSHFLFKKNSGLWPSRPGKVIFLHFFSKKVVHDPLDMAKVLVSHAFIYAFSYSLTHSYMRSKKKNQNRIPYIYTCIFIGSDKFIHAFSNKRKYSILQKKKQE